MAQLFFQPVWQAVDANGAPLSGALLYFFNTGTSTPLTVYQDSGLVTPHAIPVVADTAGMFAPIYVNVAQYKVVLKTSAGVTVQTVDPVSVNGGNTTLESTDSGATAGPILTLLRSSDTPATNDTIGEVLFQGKDSAANTQDYAVIDARIDDATSTSEDATLRLRAVTAGTMTTALTLSGILATIPGGNVVIGHTAGLSIGGSTDNLEVFGTTTATGGLALGMFNATAGTAAHLDFYRSKNAAIGSATVVASGDALGKINFYGAQQTGTFATQTMGAQIRAEVDLTVSDGAGGDMPGRIVFATTADGGSTVTDRLIIDSEGTIKPSVDNTQELGDATHQFADLFLGSGADIDFNSDMHITHTAAGILSVYAGGSGTLRLMQTTSSAPGAGNNTVGAAITSGGQSFFSATSANHCFNRTDDGTLISLLSGGTAQGSIAIAGAVTSYNAFFGSHWSQLADGSKPDILRGTICESIDEMCAWPGEAPEERLPRFKISDTPGSKAVYGVFAWWDDDWEATNDAHIGALGAFVIRIDAGQIVQRGDYIESAGNGCGRVQADDLMRSSTVAKITAAHIVETYPDGSYLVPCTLHCG